MIDVLNTYNTTDYLRIKFDLKIYNSPSDSNQNCWAKFLVEKNNWLDNFDHSQLKTNNKQELLSLASLLEVITLLCHLVRLPIFDYPKIRSISNKELANKKLGVELEIQLIDNIPVEIYKTILKVALQICAWINQNDYTGKNRDHICKLINNKIVRPLKKSIPAGKSTIPVLKVAHSLGIPFTHLGLGAYQIGWGSKARKLDRSTCELDSAIGARLSQNKVTTANILRRAGLPAPVHLIAPTEEDAVLIARKIGFPVVIKPSDLDRGDGVSIDINNEESVRHAYQLALKLSKMKQVLVEKQVQGVCHRLFILNDKLLYAVKRHPTSVFGDQFSTVKQLIDNQINEQNDLPPWRQSGIKEIDELALKTLINVGYTLDSIPRKGQMVPLRPIESTEHGGVDEDLTSAVHPSNLKIALQAPKLLGLHIAGVDIITTDISVPWYKNGAILNEVNFAPLLGGAEISRSYLGNFFQDFISDNGKIPIQIFKTKNEALNFVKISNNNRQRCFLMHSNKVIDNVGQEIVMPFNDFKSQLKALLMRADVDAVAIVARPQNSPVS